MTGRGIRVAALRLAGTVMAGVGGLAVLAGAVMIVADLATRSDEWDGLWIFLGTFIGIPGLMLVLAGVTVVKSASRSSGTSALITGFVGLITLIAAANEGDAFGLRVMTPMVVSGLVLIAVAASCGRAASIDSPGGSSR